MVGNPLIPNSVATLLNLVQSTLQEHDGGEPLNPELSGHLTEPGAVHPTHPDRSFYQRLSHVLPDWFQLLAVPAPGGVELHQPHPFLPQGQEPVTELQNLPSTVSSVDVHGDDHDGE